MVSGLGCGLRTAATFSRGGGPRGGSGLLPKGRRLVRRRDFEQVFSRGRIFDGPLVRIIWSRGKGRVAVVAAKAVGSLARRNTVRRRWREAVSGLLDLIPDDLDLVVIVKEGGAVAGWLERTAALKRALVSVREASEGQVDKI